MNETEVGLGVLGAGTVGTAFCELVLSHATAIRERSGVNLKIRAIGIRDINKRRSPEIPAELFTTDTSEIVKRDDVDLVVELIGGLEPAKTLISSALNNSKPVVTANKELIAAHGPQLWNLASESGVDIQFEAAVGGAIPLVRTLRESLAGENIKAIRGIVNGTTNYILTKMSEEGMSYEAALEDAKRLGYAELDPTADVEGFDAASKAAILAMLGFGSSMTSTQVNRTGITGITSHDIRFASKNSFTIKLLANVVRQKDSVYVDVAPTLVPNVHPLANVRESFNAIFIEGESVSEIMLYGRGAGGTPTASAVLGDVIDTAHNILTKSIRRAPVLRGPAIASASTTASTYYMQIEVNDQPGVLAEVADTFASAGVSIQSLEQTGSTDQARLIFITHPCLPSEADHVATRLNELDSVKRVISSMAVLADKA